MSGCLPVGDPTHVAFISCQMHLLIILSLPGVSPPRQQKPPFLSPLPPPLLTPGDRESLFPLLTHPTIFSFSPFHHRFPPSGCCTSYIHTLFPLLIHTSGKGYECRNVGVCCHLSCDAFVKSMPEFCFRYRRIH